MKKPEHPLAKERKRKNLTQRELAMRTHLSARTIWCAENYIPISLDSRRRICGYLRKTSDQLGLTPPLTSTESFNEPEKWSTFEDLEQTGGNTLSHFDGAKRDTLRLLGFIGLTAAANLADQGNQAVETHVGDGTFDLDLIGEYINVLQRLLVKGESSIVLQYSQNLYDKLERIQQTPRDYRLLEVRARIGILLGTAQDYALPWYSRDRTVLQTYNSLENALFTLYPLTDALRFSYAQLLAKRGRHYRVLWQFDAGIQACEAGLTCMQLIDNFALHTHFVCERAHIEATRGDEYLWLHKLEAARLCALAMDSVEQEKSLNQIAYMQGEGYKRLAFHSQKKFSLLARERYAKLAISHFSQYDGATIELPGFESLVAQTSKAQCLILVHPDEALSLAGQLRKQAEQNYPALLDKIYRVEVLANRRILLNNQDFLQFLAEPIYRTGKNVL